MSTDYVQLCDSEKLGLLHPGAAHLRFNIGRGDWGEIAPNRAAVN